MHTIKMSSKGQVIIPKPLRKEHHWDTGQELILTNTRDGILLKPKTAFPKTAINNVAPCLHYKGKTKTLNDFKKAIAKGVLDKTQ